VKTEDSVFLTAEPKFIKAGILTPLMDAEEVRPAVISEQYALFGKQCSALKTGALASLKSGTKRMAKKAEAAYVLRAENGEDE
jgi:hypothetical protein